MSIYLKDVPLSQALELFRKALVENDIYKRLGVESIKVDENAVNRVSAEPIWAKISSPHYHASAMDGFAIRSLDTSGATLALPIVIPLLDSSVNINLVGGIAKPVNTGDPIPDWSDCVMPIENVELLDEDGSVTTDLNNVNSIRIREALTPWLNVRSVGEDLVVSQLVLTAGQKIEPVNLGVIAASGNSFISVARKPKVAIIPTGSELVEIGENLNPGNIIEFNSIILASQIHLWGGEAQRWQHVPDEIEEITQSVLNASIDNDLILLIAGSSAGSKDFSARVIESIGTLLVHGVAIRPGHPVILGIIKRSNGKNSRRDMYSEVIPIIGIPGYPVSATLTSEIFVEPLLACWLGRPKYVFDIVQAELTRKVTSPGGDDEFQRVMVGRVGDKLLAAPLSKGAGVISSLSNANGIVVVPKGIQGYQAGAKVGVRLYCNRQTLDHTIFMIGSHDISIDLLTQFCADYGRWIRSVNVGSISGLLAIERGESHIAGTHLFDPQSGYFNIPYVKKYINHVPVKLISFVTREQGLIVPKGNPMNIQSIDDLVSDDIMYINRQRGAGTRVLFDYLLENRGIESIRINGYKNAVFTHLAVAADIASDRANCGMGIRAAANALELDFIPIISEKYQLVIPKVYYESELLEPIIEILHDNKFHRSILSIPGYELDSIGEIVAEIN